MLGQRRPRVQPVQEIRIEDALDEIQRIPTEVDTGEHHVDRIAGGQPIEMLIDILLHGLPEADAARWLIVELAKCPEDGTQQVGRQLARVHDEEFTAAVQDVWIAQAMGGAMLQNRGDQLVLLDFDAFRFDVSFESFLELFVAKVEGGECFNDSGQLRFVDRMDIGVQPAGQSLEAAGGWDVARAKDFYDFGDCVRGETPKDGADTSLEDAQHHATADAKSGQNGVDELDVVLVNVAILVGEGGPEFLGRSRLTGGGELMDAFADLDDGQAVAGAAREELIAEFRYCGGCLGKQRHGVEQGFGIAIGKECVQQSVERSVAACFQCVPLVR